MSNAQRIAKCTKHQLSMELSFALNFAHISSPTTQHFSILVDFSSDNTRSMSNHQRPQSRQSFGNPRFGLVFRRIPGRHLIPPASLEPITTLPKSAPSARRPPHSTQAEAHCQPSRHGCLRPPVSRPTSTDVPPPKGTCHLVRLRLLALLTPCSVSPTIQRTTWPPSYTPTISILPLTTTTGTYLSH